MLRKFGVVGWRTSAAILILLAFALPPSFAQEFPPGLEASHGAGTPPTLGAPPALHGPGISQSRNVAAAPPVETATRTDTTDYRLGAGDRVRVTVFGQQDLTGIYSVDGSGNLAFPLVGQVRAAGLTGSELQGALVASLSPKYIKDPSVTVEVLSYRPFYILGEVRTPGSYPYVFGMTVLHAVALAGGYTYRAREDDFRVTRTSPDGGKTHLDVTEDTPVEPGDIITVRERFF